MKRKLSSAKKIKLKKLEISRLNNLDKISGGNDGPQGTGTMGFICTSEVNCGMSINPNDCPLQDHVIIGGH